jgi:hypothetical protein
MDVTKLLDLVYISGRLEELFVVIVFKAGLSIYTLAINAMASTLMCSLSSFFKKDLWSLVSIHIIFMIRIYMYNL